nr:amidohydrolase family protein [Bernardetiaceae bacterium]
EVYEKIAVARQLSRPVDGHAPGLRGEQARQYIAAGISTDHECTTQAEAEEKLELGMKIIVREGSAAKNFAALIGLLPQYWPQMMFGSDDKHPDDLVEGHLNQLVARAVALGYDVFKVLQMACVNPVQHYGLPVGQLRVGDPADFIVVDNLRAFNVLQTYIDGQLVAERGQTRLPSVPVAPVNQFAARTLIPADLQVRATALRLRAIEALDGELLTRELILPARIEQGLAVADVARDLLKIVVVNRYADRPPAVAFIRNFGLRAGAIASSVAHDSHNVIAVGATDEALCQAIHLVMAAQGGVSVCGPAGSQVLPLPVAGLMAAQDGYQVAQAYSAIDRQAKALGSSLRSPYMTLSFMALLVIPALKLSDLGLFDGQKFEFVDLFVD